jgi:hypothetical protein
VALQWGKSCTSTYALAYLTNAKATDSKEERQNCRPELAKKEIRSVSIADHPFRSAVL